jgi:hypothetical protein
MSIERFIQDEILAPRLQDFQVLTVYDPDRRYRTLCTSMAQERRGVVDTSDSSIESRNEAITALGRLGRHEIDELLIYVPASKPLEEEAKQNDPFALYAACGAMFPDGDGDSYLSLCLKAKPDHSSQIRNIFTQDSNPDFGVIDAIGGGQDWPTLRSLLDVESARDILFALLAPSDKQDRSLKSNETWVSETKTLFQTTLGLSLKTTGKTWKSIGEELWRYILFSEFVFDLPVDLPESLEDVPHGQDSIRPLVEDLCDRLRNDRRTRDLYIDRAEGIEKELRLDEICSVLPDLGIRDTFPFEEQSFLRNATAAFLKSDFDEVRQILDHHSRSVWTGKGESQIHWHLLRSALSLTEACRDQERALADHSKSMESLVDHYVSHLREVDRLQREFEQSVSDYEWQDTLSIMEPVQQLTRGRYGSFMEKIQLHFTGHLRSTGWPITGRLFNADVFDQYVAPHLQQSGQRVAFIMVDALRYELGLALEQQLAEDGAVALNAALAQLPTTTPVGMASLLPGAGSGLQLKSIDSKPTPHLADAPVGTVPQRMDAIRKRYGQRFQEGRLEEFVRNRLTIDDHTDLLVLRSVEIDSFFESNPDIAPTEIINALKRIRRAVHRLKTDGFGKIIIATDHGFFMNTHAGPGDTCAKLPGNWVNIHQRCLLGEGSADNHHYLIGTDKAGIRGDYTSIAGPLTLASYQSGMLYYHGGASLQECVLPVITLDLDINEQPEIRQANVVLNYKNGVTRITTRLPVVEISIEDPGMFSDESEFEVLLEAHDKKGNVVGEAKPGGLVNAATGTVTLKAGDKAQITLRMTMDYEGAFKIKALDPSTMTVYHHLDMKTDYTV